MPVVYREDSDSPAWGMLAIVLVGVLFVALMGYFLWWNPNNTNAAPAREVSSRIRGRSRDRWAPCFAAKMRRLNASKLGLR